MLRECFWRQSVKERAKLKLLFVDDFRGILKVWLVEDLEIGIRISFGFLIVLSCFITLFVSLV